MAIEVRQSDKGKEWENKVIEHVQSRFKRGYATYYNGGFSHLVQPVELNEQYRNWLIHLIKKEGYGR